jgi:hypothetical protein
VRPVDFVRLRGSWIAAVVRQPRIMADPRPSRSPNASPSKRRACTDLAVVAVEGAADRDDGAIGERALVAERQRIGAAIVADADRVMPAMIRFFSVSRSLKSGAAIRC